MTGSTQDSLSVLVEELGDGLRLRVAFRKVFFDLFRQVVVVDDFGRPEEGAALDPDDVALLELDAHLEASNLALHTRETFGVSKGT